MARYEFTGAAPTRAVVGLAGLPQPGLPIPSGSA